MKPVDDPAAAAAMQAYQGWTKVNDEPVLSATHGNRNVFTYINEEAKAAGLEGSMPFSVGAVLVKESFDKTSGAAGPVFIMEKREAGYDPDRGDWHYAMSVDDAIVRSGNSQGNSAVKFCSDCHMAMANQDFVFGNGTVMKLK